MFMKHMKLYASGNLRIHVLCYFSKMPIAHQFFMQPGLLLVELSRASRIYVKLGKLATLPSLSLVENYLLRPFAKI